MVTVTVCVGSSCHIKGARDVILRFNDLLVEHGLQRSVELKGSFCMERCGEGLNWRIDDEPLTSAGVEDAVEAFTTRVIEPALRAEGRDAGPKGDSMDDAH